MGVHRFRFHKGQRIVIVSRLVGDTLGARSCRTGTWGRCERQLASRGALCICFRRHFKTARHSVDIQRIPVLFNRVNTQCLYRNNIAREATPIDLPSFQSALRNNLRCLPHTNRPIRFLQSNRHLADILAQRRLKLFNCSLPATAVRLCSITQTPHLTLTAAPKRRSAGRSFFVENVITNGRRTRTRMTASGNHGIASVRTIIDVRRAPGKYVCR